MILKMIFMETLAQAGMMIIQEAAVGTIQISLTHALCAVLVQIKKNVSKKRHKFVQTEIVVIVTQNQKELLGGLE
jgi:hypothetical protein